MLSEILARQTEIREVAVKHRVHSLALFGSAASGDFEAGESDLDFLVEFQPMPVREYADHYFGLMEDLQRLFQAPVDLVEARPLKNPYFRRSVEETKRVLYEAA